MSDIDLSAAVRVWEDVVGDSGHAPSDDELHTFAQAIEAAVREQIIEALDARMEQDDAQQRTDFSEGLWSGLNEALHIARGEQP